MNNIIQKLLFKKEESKLHISYFYNTNINDFSVCTHSQDRKHYCLGCETPVCFNCSNLKHKSHCFATSPMIDTIGDNFQLLKDHLKNVNLKLTKMEKKIEDNFKYIEILSFKYDLSTQIRESKNNQVNIILANSVQTYSENLQIFISKMLKDVGLGINFLDGSDFLNKNYNENIPSIVLYFILTGSKRIYYEDFQSGYELYLQKPNSKTLVTIINLGSKSELPRMDKAIDFIGFSFDFNYTVIEDSNYTRSAIVTIQNTFKHLR